MFVTIFRNENLNNVGYGWDTISWNGCLVSLGSNWGFVGSSWYVELVNIFSNATFDNFSKHGNTSGIIVANGSDTSFSMAFGHHCLNNIQ
jgi:hypothetical protein